MHEVITYKHVAERELGVMCQFLKKIFLRWGWWLFMDEVWAWNFYKQWHLRWKCLSLSWYCIRNLSTSWISGCQTNFLFMTSIYYRVKVCTNFVPKKQGLCPVTRNRKADTLIYTWHSNLYYPYVRLSDTLWERAPCRQIPSLSTRYRSKIPQPWDKFVRLQRLYDKLL